jgi:hypothetical protein
MKEIICDSILRIITSDIAGLKENGFGMHRNDAITDSFPNSVYGWKLLFGYPPVVLLRGRAQDIKDITISLKDGLRDSYDFEFKNVTSKELSEDFVRDIDEPSGADGGIMFVTYISGYQVLPSIVDRILMKKSDDSNLLQSWRATGGRNTYGPFEEWQEEDFFKSGLGLEVIRTGWNVIICINSIDSYEFNIGDFSYLDKKLHDFRIPFEE